MEIIVSNHGGRAIWKEPLNATWNSEDEIKGRIPVLIDEESEEQPMFCKALAMGAMPYALGRPFCWGLGAWVKKRVDNRLDDSSGGVCRGQCNSPGQLKLGNTRGIITLKKN